MKNIPKLLESVSIDQAIEITKEAIANPDRRYKTLKDNQWLGWFIAKLYATQWYDDLKKEFKEKIIDPWNIIKKNKKLSYILNEIKTTEELALSEMGWGWYMKIINQYHLSSWSVAIILWIAYKEETRWPIKYKHTLLYVVDEDILKEIVKNYDVLEKSFM